LLKNSINDFSSAWKRDTYYFELILKKSFSCNFLSLLILTHDSIAYLYAVTIENNSICICVSH